MTAFGGVFSSFGRGNRKKRIQNEVTAKNITDAIPVFAAFNHAFFMTSAPSAGISRYIVRITLTPKKETDAIVAEIVHKSLKKDFISSCITTTGFEFLILLTTPAKASYPRR